MTPLALGAPVALFDLGLTWTEGTAGDGLAAALSYATDLFDAATARRLLAHLEALLDGLARDTGRRLSELPLLSAAERHQLTAEWNDTRAQPGEDVLARFERMAQAAPDAVALTVIPEQPAPADHGEELRLTYGALDARAESLAERLRAVGIGPGVTVALATSRGPALAAGLLAIWKAGGVFLPLDPALPAARLAFMLDDAQAAVVLGEPRTLAVLPPHRAAVLAITGATAVADEGSMAPARPAPPTASPAGFAPTARSAALAGPGARAGKTAPAGSPAQAGSATPAEPVATAGQIAGSGTAASAGPEPPPAAAVPGAPLRRAARGDLAYLIYTSGTTGQPKAVAVERGNLADQLAASRELLRFGAADRVLAVASFAFDIFLVELLAPLTTGGTAVLFPLHPVLDVERLAALLPELTVAHAVPALARQLLAAHRRQGGRPLPALRALLVGGDAVPGELLVDLRQSLPQTELWELYGPTETTILAAAWPVPRSPEAGRSLLGRPLPGYRLELRDRHANLVPIGVAAEIWIAGAGVARGYLNRPALTAEKYVAVAHPGGRLIAATSPTGRPVAAVHPAGQPLPVDSIGQPVVPIDSGGQLVAAAHAAARPAAAPGGRAYRSGDLGRQLPDGSVEFLGRIDGQVKVRGFRVETAEIETALARHPAVVQAAVLALPAPDGARLEAYVVARQPATTTLAAELREALRQTLPDYMLPAAFVWLDSLPLTANAKLDRHALAAAGAARHERGAGAPDGQLPAPPRDAIEAGLVEIWSEVLGRADIAVADDFFALGGHSLLAVRLMAAIRQRFGHALPLAALFRANTVERLAALLRTGAAAAGRAALVELTPPASAAIVVGADAANRGALAAAAHAALPFFCVHPAGGNVLCYTELARSLGPAQPFYGLQLPDPATLGPDPAIETLATRYLAAVAEVSPAGPYALGGWSIGAVIAYEMARQLRAAGETVELLALIDPPPLGQPTAAAPDQARLQADFAGDLVALAATGAAVSPEDLRRLDPGQPLPDLIAAIQALGLLPPELGADDAEQLFALFRTIRLAHARYRPAPYPGPLTLLLASQRLTSRLPSRLPSDDKAGGAAPPHPSAAAWAALAGAGAELESLPGDHYSIVRPPAVALLAQALRRRLSSASQPAGHVDPVVPGVAALSA